MRWLVWVFALSVMAVSLFADVRGCVCDPANRESMEARGCGLTKESLSQPANVKYFFLKDSNPRKPNRWLILPTGSGAAAQFIEEMTKEQRLELWRAAVAKAKELFGDEWGLAYNGTTVRTQCHFHIHIGRFIKAAETSRFKTIYRLEDIPVPQDGGLWIHPVGRGYHVHEGEQICETALVR